MPHQDPAVGEVWTAGSQAGLVTARGANQIRLVSRVGRRVSYPLSSFVSMWSLRDLIPREPQGCSVCEDEAFLRHRDGDEIKWVCERHAPQGSNLYFPSDDPEQRADLQYHCPQCDSLSVTEHEARVTRDASYLRRSCNSCGSSWYTIDTERVIAIVLLTDLPRLADTFNEVTHNVTIQCGFRAERLLTRSTGISPDHLQGIPIRHNGEMASESINLLAVPRSLDGSGPMTQSAPILDPTTLDIPEEIRRRLEAQSEGMGAVTELEEPAPGTFWRRKRSDNKVLLAEVQGTNETGCVEYEILFNPSNIRLGSSWDTRANPPMSAEQFKEHWTFVNEVADVGRHEFMVPQENSFWKNVDTKQVVRIREASQAGVRFYRPENPDVAVTEELNSFSRLYSELVYPPGDTLWVVGDRIHEVVSWEGDGGYDTVRVTLRQLGGEPQEVPLLDLFSRYDAMSFHVSSRIAKSTYPLYQGATWSRDGTNVAIHDIGWANGQEYVRFTREDKEVIDWFEQTYERDGVTICVLPLRLFESCLEPVWPEAPCEIGDIWLLKEDESQGFRVVSVDRPQRRVGLDRQGVLGSPTSVSFDELVQDYRKMEIMTLWDHLD